MAAQDLQPSQWQPQDPQPSQWLHNGSLTALNLPMSLDLLRRLNSPGSNLPGSVEVAVIHSLLLGQDMRDVQDAGAFIPNLPRRLHHPGRLGSVNAAITHFPSQGPDTRDVLDAGAFIPNFPRRLHHPGRLESANAVTNPSTSSKQDMHNVLDAGAFVLLHLHRLHPIPPHNARSVGIYYRQATISRVVQNADLDEARC
jgi:hypothetical protein